MSRPLKLSGLLKMKPPVKNESFFRNVSMRFREQRKPFIISFKFTGSIFPEREWANFVIVMLGFKRNFICPHGNVPSSPLFGWFDPSFLRLFLSYWCRGLCLRSYRLLGFILCVLSFCSKLSRNF